MKRVLSVFLALAIIFLMIPMGAVTASAEQSGDYVYDFSGPTTVMITGYTGAGGNVVIPDKLDGYTVDEITDGAFYNCTAMTSVVIPNSVTVIGFNSFAQCSGLTSVTISDSVTVIETGAFGQCTGLKSVKIGSNVKTIGSSAFVYCSSLTSIDIPNSVTLIETSAFGYCTAMTDVSIPDSVTDIGVSAFEHCYGLTGVIIPKWLSAISNGLFDGCSKLASIVIPEGVTTIGDSAFKRCEALTGVIIPNSVTVIGSQAFEGCIGLTAIAIPNSVTNIGDSAFSNCTGLADIILSNGLTIIKDSTFERCLALTEVIIPSSVTDIKDLAFNYCSALSKATFFGNAPILNSMVFDGCAEGFKVFYIDGNATFPNPWHDYETAVFVPLATPSFSSAPVLPTNGNVSVEITFPGDAVTKEFKLGLDDWTAYTTPVTLTENGTVYARCKDAGVNTSDIGSIIVSNVDKVAPAAPVLEAIPLSLTESDVTVTITYPADAAVKEYKLAGGGWLAYNDPVVLSANNTVVARCTDSAGNLSNESSISVNNIIHTGDFSYDIVGTSATVTGYTGAGGAVTIPDMLGGYPVTIIGHDSFMGCEELTSIIIPDSVTSIEADAFHLCSGLTGLSIPNSVTDIGDYAFKACAGLTSLIIGTGVTNIGTGAFSNCSLLTGVSIPDSVTTIGNSAFGFCVALTDLSFGSSVGDIGLGAFQGCGQLAGAYFFGNAPQIDDEVFTFCAPDFTVYYIEGKTGFESPWHGYTTATFTPLATPVLSATPSSPTKGNVTVTITYPASPVTKEYKLNTGVWTPYTGPLVLSVNNSVFARCRDGAGILSRLGSITVSNIDKIAPNVPIFESLPSEPTRDEVTVTITFPADAVVKQYKLSESPWMVYTEPFVLWDNDIVLAKCTDAAGNVSSIGTFDIKNIDRVPPTDPVISANPTEPTNGDVTVTITYPPDAAVKEYRIMGGSGPENWTPYTAPVNITAICLVFARCADAAGNYSEESFIGVTNIDKQGPDTPVLYANPEMPTTGDVTVTVTYPEDAQIKEYKVGSGDWSPYTTAILLTQNDTVYARCADALGNFSETVTIFVDNIDRVSPANPTFTANPALPTNGNVSVTINYPEDAVLLEYKLVEGYWIDYEGPVLLNANGEVFARCTDAAGNSSGISSIEVNNIDKIAPVIPVLFASTILPTKDNLTVTVTYPEDAAVKEYRLGDEGWAAYTDPVVLTDNGILYARCKDSAGNISEVASIAVNNIDKIAPAPPTLAASTVSPTNGSVKITISYPPDAVLKQYRFSAGAWTSYSTPVIVSANDTIYARCSDAVGNISATGLIVVSNIAVNGFLYSISGSAATITGYIGTGGAVTIPGMLDGYPVTAIGAGAFLGCLRLTGVTIGSSVISIGDSAFSGCTVLTNVVLGSWVANVGEEAFAGCTGLTGITIPNSVKTIGNGAFNDCNGLTAIIVDAGNTAYSDLNGVLFNKTKTSLIRFPGGKPGDYEIPGGVLEICDEAFCRCTLLTGITIPDSVTFIGDSGFSGCTALEGVLNIGTGVTNIGNSAFYGCTGITGVFIPDGVVDIGSRTFQGCTGLTRVTIPGSVTDTGWATFAGCSELLSVTIQNGVTSIGSRAFSGCAKLTEVNLLDSIESIGELAFYGCLGLATLIIPDSITAIGSDAFFNCEGLTAATFLGDAPSMGENVFDGCGTGFTVYYYFVATGFTSPTWQGYPSQMINFYISACSGSSTVINNNYIFGLKAGVTKTQFENAYIQWSGKVHLEYSTAGTTLGTGTAINVVDNTSNEILIIYTIIIFGDVNGDGNIDSIDAGTAVDVENGITDWTPGDNAAQYLAGDVNLDGNIDSLDAGLMVDCENKMMNINQVTGCAE